MESRARLFGHPLHPILIVFPLGLLTTSVVFDMVAFWTANRYFSGIAYWMLATGLIGGVLAGIAGLIDYRAIPPRTRAKRIATWHGAGNVVVLLLFGFSWYLRYANPEYPARGAEFVSFLSLMLLGVTGWLGGELVNRLGIGVHDGANLNAPSSLRNTPRRAA